MAEPGVTKNLVLALDVGNTQTVIGMYQDGSLAASWRIASSSNRSEDELGVVLVRLIDLNGFDRSALEGAILASVVPPVTQIIENALRKYLHIDPLIVGPGMRTGVKIHYESPKDVGADRIVNAIAAHERVGDRPCIVADFGTATTFDCVGPDGSYLGGVIAPGANISLEALVARAAKLPRIEIERPQRMIGQNTTESMQSGIFYGYVSLVEGLVQRLRNEMQERFGLPAVVLATGGLSRVFEVENIFDEVLSDLTLDGLWLLYERNKE